MFGANKLTHSLFCNFQCSPAIKRIYRSQGEEQEKAVQDATEHLERLENELRGKKFFGGDEIGLVDLSATFIALWLGVLLELAGVELLQKRSFQDYVSGLIFT